MIFEVDICFLGTKQDRVLYTGCSAAVIVALDWARASHIQSGVLTAKDKSIPSSKRNA